MGCRQLDRCETLNFPGNGLSSAEEFSWTAAQESTVYRHPSRDGGGGWQCHRSSGKIDPCLQAESQLAKGSWISRSGHSLKFGNDNCIPHSVITRLHGTPSNLEEYLKTAHSFQDGSFTSIGCEFFSSQGSAAAPKLSKRDWDQSILKPSRHQAGWGLGLFTNQTM